MSQSNSNRTSQGLKANSIGLSRVVAYTAAFIGPAASIALGLVVAVSFAGYATPLAVLLAFIAALCASSTLAQFARRLPSAGSFFTYHAVALGRPIGFLSGWMMTFAYVVFVPSGIAATGHFLSVFFSDAFGVGINENIFLVLTLVLVMVLAYEGITTSANVDIVLLVIEMVVIAALAATIYIKGGPGSSQSLFNPSNSLHGHFSDIALAMIYTMVIFTGFESGAVLGEESENPRRTIPIGLLSAVTIVGIFYLFVSIGELRGVGPEEITKYAANPNQLSFLTERYWSSDLQWLIDLVVALSTLAFTISTFNSGVRLAFAMGREGMLPARLARLSSRQTPHIAILVIGIFAVIVALPITILTNGFLAFGYLGGVAGVAFLFVYVTLPVACIAAFSTRWRAERNILLHYVLPVIAGVIFLIPLVGSFYPVPAFPFDVLPYFAILWLIIGIGVAIYYARRRPETLAAIGRVFTEA